MVLGRVIKTFRTIEAFIRSVTVVAMLNGARSAFVFLSSIVIQIVSLFTNWNTCARPYFKVVVGTFIAEFKTKPLKLIECTSAFVTEEVV